MSDSGGGTASGVYYSVIDESYQSVSTNILEGIVPMITVRGEIGLNRVTIEDYEDVVGFDLNYNPNYQGLVEMLESVSYLDVLRINQDPMYGNVIIQEEASSYQNPSTLDPSVLASSEETKTGTISLPAALADIDLGEGAILEGTLSLYIAAALVASDDGEGNLVAENASGVSGTIVYATGIINAASTAGPVDAQFNFTSAKVNSIAFWMKTPGDWDTLAVTLAEYRQTYEFANTPADNMAVATEVDSLKLYDLSDLLLAHEETGVWVEDNSSGIAGAITRDVDGITSFTLTTSTTDASLQITYVEQDEKLVTLYTYRKTGTTSYQLLATETFSTDTTSSEYLNIKTDLEYLSGEIVTPIDSDLYDVKYDLGEADNGTTPLATQLDLDTFNSSSAVVVIGNGITDATLISTIAEKCDTLKKSFLFDVPNYAKWTDLEAWQYALYGTEYAQAYWVSDQITSDVGTISLWPSVNVFKAYAKMLSDTGYLYYPPAGYDYASIVVESLLTTDVAVYADTVKLKKINYQKVGNKGPVIWEQRTRYSAESDLTFANTVWVLRGAANEMVSYMENFNFRYISPTDLGLYQTGLESILDAFVDNGFIWTYSVDVPTWTEVKDSGSRVVDIYVTIQVAKDGEVFNLKLVLSSTAVS